ncbi:telomerase inhibitor [Madurella fahalii]|uniref:PinX1-related protein 1 n=1 Tax=Madurella fahalii TaxID=1157608 RepID=A0ABQ0FZN6_9PEZI
MGLAAAKNKRKLGNDPNNTKWSRNTDSFGQKILRAQGWQPGQYLGAKDAPHAEWHTEANSTHIRVVLKDDNLGLGAKRNNGDECTGLDAFQHLLGRLNGKSDETLETERKAREDMKLSLYVERKLGTIRFVKGGWLVGDQVKDRPGDETTEPQSSAVPEAPRDSADNSSTSESAPKPKKRTADQDTDVEGEKMRKKEKKFKKRKADPEGEGDNDGPVKKDKKSKKKRTETEEADTEPPASSKSNKRTKDKEAITEDSSRSTSVAISQIAESPDEAGGSIRKTRAGKREKKKDKKDKKDRKEKKEKRKKVKASSDSEAESGDSISREKKRRKDNGVSVKVADPSDLTTAGSGLSTPSGSGYSTPVPTGSSRYLARSRFIAQKRMAFTDSTALNQIFMIKS